MRTTYKKRGRYRAARSAVRIVTSGGRTAAIHGTGPIARPAPAPGCHVCRWYDGRLMFWAARPGDTTGAFDDYMRGFVRHYRQQHGGRS